MLAQIDKTAQNIEDEKQIAPETPVAAQQKEEPEKKVKEYKLQYPEPTGTITVILDDDKFIFNDMTGTQIGIITINDIVNYINNTAMATTIKNLLELTIFDKKDKTTLNTRSPFMNNLEILFVLNRLFKTISQSEIKPFIYSLLEHTLNTIALASHQMKDMPDSMKQKLMKYSIGIVYQMMQCISTSLMTHEQHYSNLLKSQDEINKTIASLNEKIKIQTDK